MSEATAHATTKYVIITRYNVRMGFTPGRLNLEEDWLRFRLELFQQTALRSVSEQTVAADAWWILIDPATPRGPLDDLTSALRSACPVPWRLIPLSSGTGELAHGLARYAPACERICTIRLDSDDRLEPFYVEEVVRWSNRASVQCRPDAFGSFPVGRIQTTGGDHYLNYEASGPFMVRCERTSMLVSTVGAIEHQMVQKRHKLDHISLRPAWTQIVHGRNISNSVKGLYVGGVTSPKFFASLLGSALVVADWLLFSWFQLRVRARSVGKGDG